MLPRQPTSEEWALVEANIGLVWGYVNRHRWLHPTAAAEEEAVSHGTLGLLRAVQTWDPEKGTLGTYAEAWIRQAIQRGRGEFGGINHRRAAAGRDPNYQPPVPVEAGLPGTDGLTYADVLVSGDDPAERSELADALREAVLRLRAAVRDPLDEAIVAAILAEDPPTSAAIAREQGVSGQTVRVRRDRLHRIARGDLPVPEVATPEPSPVPEPADGPDDAALAEISEALHALAAAGRIEMIVGDDGEELFRLAPGDTGRGFYDILTRLCAGVPQPEQVGRGQRVLRAADVFATLIARKPGASIRDAAASAVELRDRGVVSAVPSAASLNRYLGMVDTLTTMLDLLSESATMTDTGGHEEVVVVYEAPRGTRWEATATIDAAGAIVAFRHFGPTDRRGPIVGRLWARSDIGLVNEALAAAVAHNVRLAAAADVDDWVGAAARTELADAQRALVAAQERYAAALAAVNKPLDGDPAESVR